MPTRCAGIHWLAAVVLVVTLVSPVRAEIDAEQVSTALARGIAYLKREQAPRGTWTEHVGQPGGVTALCTMALLSAGVPPEDPHVQRALANLRTFEPKMTYATALQTMAFCAAEPKQDLVLIRRNARWLEETQIKQGEREGGWSYPGAGGDNSNAQFAILALHEAERAGVKVSDDTWRRAHEYWTGSQRPEGSWGYFQGMPGTGSMTCAGLAAVVITSGKVSAGDAKVIDGVVHCCGRHEEEESIERGIAWLGRNFSVHRNPTANMRSQGWLYYYLYGLERVGRLTARRFIGSHDWYREGAEKLVADQDVLSGFWKGAGHAENHPHIATSLALLFLSKGRRPVLIAKARHEPGEDWNNHRGDLANLTAYTEQQWKRDLTWQVVDPRAASVEDLLQTPVLFIGGRHAPEFSPREKQNLRDYIDRGGFIFADANCGGDQFDRGFRRLMAEIFPEPEYQLRLLPPEHPVWHAEQRVDPDYMRPLWGIDYGCRTSVIYSPEDLSCYWELSRSGRDEKFPAEVQKKIDAANAMGVNVLTYATGREPRYKDAIPREFESEPELAGDDRGTLKIAKLLHPGGCNAAPGALVNLLQTAGRELKLRVRAEERQLAITDKDLFRYHLVFMHGRNTFRLTPAERKQLRLYLEQGGTIFADAICASEEFADSFRREMKEILPNRPLERIRAGDPLFTPEFGGYDIRQVTRRDPGLRVGSEPLRARLREVEPDLEAIQLGDRYAVIFSPYDISCALERHESLQCNGYIREDALRIGINVLLYSLHR